MKIIAVGLLALLSIATIPNIQIKTDEKTTPIHQETVLAVETSTEPPEKETPVKEPENESEPKLDPVKDNPNKCNLDTHYVWEDFTCHEKPKATSPAPNQTTTTPTASSATSGSGSCEAEIKKYSWNHSVATAVMFAESGGRTWVVNDNPSTRDYSVGCFQVNLYGANARNRPSEAALKNASTNVAWAYNNYKANGSSFIGQWGVCRSAVQCY